MVVVEKCSDRENRGDDQEVIGKGRRREVGRKGRAPLSRAEGLTMSPEGP